MHGGIIPSATKCCKEGKRRVRAEQLNSGCDPGSRTAGAIPAEAKPAQDPRNVCRAGGTSFHSICFTWSEFALSCMAVGASGADPVPIISGDFAGEFAENFAKGIDNPRANCYYNKALLIRPICGRSSARLDP